MNFEIAYFASKPLINNSSIFIFSRKTKPGKKGSEG